MAIPTIAAVTEFLEGLPGFDSNILIAPPSNHHHHFKEPIEKMMEIDSSFGKDVCLIPTPKASKGRLVVSPVGPLTGDTDDVRRFADAAKKGILRARAAGSKHPLLILHGVPSSVEYSHALQVALLAAMEASYVELQAREAEGDAVKNSIEKIGYVFEGPLSEALKINEIVEAIEIGRRLSRDIGNGDPERMTAIRAAAYIQQAFLPYEDCVKVEIIEDDAVLKKDYPLLHAVARASIVVPRHKPVVVRLEYVPSGPVEQTILIAGKGVTFDTGGANIKSLAGMLGMSKDKCGAAAAAGFVMTAACSKAKGIRIVAELGFVRNSVGADAYLPDEIITSHAGVRCSIGNTDAEGRLVLADVLSHLREQALKEEVVNPRFFIIATLTGHAALANGPYTTSIDNAPAKELSVSKHLQDLGHIWGEPLEVSTLRREDFAMIQPKNNTYDALQCNAAGSATTIRGHQFPFAFMLKASGLSEHGRNSKKPFPCTHLDIAGSLMGDSYLGTPIVSLSAQFIVPKI